MPKNKKINLNRYMLVSEYRKKRFTPKSRPSEKTIKRWIVKGDLPGRKVGGLFYVDIDEEVRHQEEARIFIEKFGGISPLALKVLMDES